MQEQLSKNYIPEEMVDVLSNNGAINNLLMRGLSPVNANAEDMMTYDYEQDPTLMFSQNGAYRDNSSSISPHSIRVNA